MKAEFVSHIVALILRFVLFPDCVPLQSVPEATQSPTPAGFDPSRRGWRKLAGNSEALPHEVAPRIDAAACPRKRDEHSNQLVKRQRAIWNSNKRKHNKLNFA